MKFIKNLIKYIENLSNVLSYIAIAAVVVLMVMTSADVFMRFAFNKPILGVMEISQMIMVILLLGLASSVQEGRHVSIDLLVNKLPTKVQKAVNTMTLLASLFICAVIGWCAYSASLFSQKFGVTISMFKIPQYPLYWILALSFAVFCVAIIAVVLKTLTDKAVKE